MKCNLLGVWESVTGGFKCVEASAQFVGGSQQFIASLTCIGPLNVYCLNVARKLLAF
jgi:hypothetical protein